MWACVWLSPTQSFLYPEKYRFGEQNGQECVWVRLPTYLPPENHHPGNHPEEGVDTEASVPPISQVTFVEGVASGTVLV